MIHISPAERVTIIGSSGSGKSNATFLQLRDLEKRLIPFVVFDTKAEYKGLEKAVYVRIIRSPDHGILVKPRDPDGLSKAIEEGMKKRWDRKRIREYGRRYSWNEIAKRTLDVYAFDN